MSHFFYFAAGCLFTTVLLSTGMWVGFLVASRLSPEYQERKRAEKEDEELTKKLDTVLPISLKAGPIKQRSPRQIEFDKQNGFNERLKEIVS